MTEVANTANPEKLVKFKSSYAPEYISLKESPNGRLEHLHTHVKQDSSELVIERIYRNRKGQHFLKRDVKRSSYLKEGTTWELTNLKIHPVIPYRGDL